MPKKAPLDFENLAKSLFQLLQDGTHAGPEICRSLGISQATFSRLVKSVNSQIAIVGKGKNTRYACLRTMPEVDSILPVYAIDEIGKTSVFGDLVAIQDQGFVFRHSSMDRVSREFDDLPFFLDDLRPAGFLGRLLPTAHPDLDLPPDIQRWSATHCLKYLSQYGCDSIGNLIIGENAFSRYLKKAASEADVIELKDRASAYPRKAREVLSFGDPGTSAAGEQPKFTARIGTNAQSVIVKFSPRISEPVSQRKADLLISEHIALEVLRRAGHNSPKSKIIQANEQVFLEVERFDRTGKGGRLGVITLMALDSEYVGNGRGWVEPSRKMGELGLVSREEVDEIRRRDLFGRLIANSDMHQGNLSFYFEYPHVKKTAPIYDMLPMRYFPRNDEIPLVEFHPPIPRASESDIWSEAWSVAVQFWNSVGSDSRISEGFRSLAIENYHALSAMKKIGELLP